MSNINPLILFQQVKKLSTDAYLIDSKTWNKLTKKERLDLTNIMSGLYYKLIGFDFDYYIFVKEPQK